MRQTTLFQQIIWAVLGINIITGVIISIYLKCHDNSKWKWWSKTINPQTFAEHPQASVWFFVCLAISLICYCLIKLDEKRFF